MIKNIIQFIFLSLIFFTFLCCNQSEEANDNLNLTVAWNINSENYGNERLALDFERGRIYVNERGSETIASINIESGKLIWRTNEILNSDTNVTFNNDYIYSIGINPNMTNITMVQLDKETGSLISNNTLGKYREILPRMNSLCLYNDTLYWGRKDRHFVYAYSTSDEKEAYPIWGSENVTSDIMGDIVPYNGRLYFVSSVYPYEDEPQPSRLVSMNPDGSDVKELEISADFLYGDNNCTQFYKGKLYLNGMYFICVNPESMEIEWELKDLDEKGLVAASGFVIDNDRIYAGVVGHGNDDFVCINAKNGKIIWREEVDTSFYGSIFYSPQVYNGYLYQPMQGCVMVLNAKNGKYVGRDEKIRTGTLAVGITERYNDLMIFSGICEGIRNVYAIKMDMHTR